MHFYDIPSFWAALVTYSGLIIAAIRYLIGFFFKKKDESLDKQREINLEKSKLDLSSEQLKADNSLRTIEGLSRLVVEIIPVVKEQREEVKRVRVVQENLTAMLKPLQDKYEEFNRIVPKATASLQQVLDDVAEMKTEIIQLKKGSPNVFVTTKK